MPLPTKDDFLAQLQPIDSNDSCPICRHEMAMPFTTACKHTFCRECLAKWMHDHPSCPTCRRNLYTTTITPAPAMDEESGETSDDSERGIFESFTDDEEDFDDLEADGEDSDSDDSSDDDEMTTHREALDTGWITLSFTIDRDAVIDKLKLRISEGRYLDYRVDEYDRDLVRVNAQTLIETAVASLLFIKPRRGEFDCFHSTGHFVWEAIIESARVAINSEDGQTIPATQLFHSLVEAAYDASRPFCRDGTFPSYSRAIETSRGDDFENDMFWFVRAIIEQARHDYTSFVEEERIASVRFAQNEDARTLFGTNASV